MFPDHLLKDSRHNRPHMASSHTQNPISQPSRPRDIVYSSGSSNMRRHTTASAASPRTMASHLVHASSALTRNDYPAPSRHYTRRDDKSQSDSPIFSFDVLRSDPSSSSLQHIASSPTFPNRGHSSAGYNTQAQRESPGGPVFRVNVPDHGIAAQDVGQSSPPPSNVINSSCNLNDGGSRPMSTRAGYSAGLISFPAAQRSRDRSPDDPDAASDDDLSGSNNNGKKHVCSTCLKRFNRPSSLRIHVNTHTGATRESSFVCTSLITYTYYFGIAFRCPWPNCAREFNVNSNMRRHYRNHTTPGASRPQHAADNRRRRNRGPSQGLVFIPGGDPRNMNSFSPPIGSIAMDEGSDGSDGGNSQDDDEEDELDSLPEEASPVHPTSERPWATQSEFSDRNHHDLRPFTRYSQSHVRSGYQDYNSSPSSSSSPSPPLRNYTYSPSAPYSRSFADPKVSTALRPAFHSKPVSTSTPGEPMSDIR
ncbi:hypothetical protein C0991_010039 [Blastosporella zonata]|nr:hypothetical protein C0991_010039 [Blastosporella zonata]